MDLLSVNWPRAHRIIATRWPPIDLFERVGDQAVQDALIAAEMLTNPRVREEIGEISIVPPERRIYGHGASFVMAPFTHIKSSRFSDGSYGVYYAGIDFETALHETIYHFCQNAADSEDAVRNEDFQILIGVIKHDFLNMDTVEKELQNKLLDPDNYTASQFFGREQRNTDIDGISYPSVRYPDGYCVAAFWPNIIGIPIRKKIIRYHYDGQNVTKYFDYASEKWIEFASLC